MHLIALAHIEQAVGQERHSTPSMKKPTLHTHLPEYGVALSRQDVQDIVVAPGKSTHRVAGLATVGFGGKEGPVVTGAAIRRNSLHHQWFSAGKTTARRAARASSAGYITRKAGRGLKEEP